MNEQGIGLGKELEVFESRPLSDEGKQAMETIKIDAAILLHAMDRVIPKEERSEASRLMNIARTNLEQTVMWAVKAISRK